MSAPTPRLEFTGQDFFIGIDVHKRSWQVTIRSSGVELKSFSMNPSPQELSQYLTKHYWGGTYHSVYEAGFCGFWIHRQLHQLGIDNIVVNPADIPTTNKERAQKTDKRDSRKMARELEKGALEAIYVPSESRQQLRSLSRLRFRNVQQGTRIKNRIKGFLHFNGVPIPSQRDLPHWSNRFIQWLYSLEFNSPAAEDYLRFCLDELQQCRQRSLAILRQLRRYSGEPDIAPTFRSLRSVIGIGFVAAISFYAEIGDMRRFTSFDQLASFVGVIPAQHASGEDPDKSPGITWRRNKYLRPLLIEAAWVAVQKDPAMTRAFYELTKRMKPQRAIVRIAKKLLRRIRHVWLNQSTYVTAVVE